MNISSVPLLKTANTCNICARQRAENIAALGAKNTIELCVGPSFETLEKNYNSFGIEFFGNDIDFRWKTFILVITG